MKAPVTLYLNPARKIVGEDAKDGLVLICRRGSEVPEDIMKRFNLREQFSKFGSVPAPAEKQPASDSTGESPVNRTLSGSTIKRR